MDPQNADAQRTAPAQRPEITEQVARILYPIGKPSQCTCSASYARCPLLEGRVAAESGGRRLRISGHPCWLTGKAVWAAGASLCSRRLQMVAHFTVVRRHIRPIVAFSSKCSVRLIALRCYLGLRPAVSLSDLKTRRAWLIFTFLLLPSFHFTTRLLLRRAAAMGCENMQLDTLASNKGEVMVEVAAQYDPDNAELTRLGKKPVLKVGASSLHSWLNFANQWFSETLASSRCWLSLAQ